MSRVPAPRLVPELICRDIDASRHFYVDLLGFRIAYERPENRFVYLERNGVELMLEELSPDSWLTGELVPPFGRGINFEIQIDGLDEVLAALAAANIPLFRGPEEAWYRDGEFYHGQRQFLVQDPDGYLLRLCVSLGTRSTPTGRGRRVERVG